MVRISVKVGDTDIDYITITNTGEEMHGGTVYKVSSNKFGGFFINHNPRAGLTTLISHVFSHYKLVEGSHGDTPTNEEEL